MKAKRIGLFALIGVMISMTCFMVTEIFAETVKNPVEIDEWSVPYGGRARDPFASGTDEIWFVGQRGNYLGRFTPSTGKFYKRDLPDTPGPHNLIVQSNGIVWYAGNLAGYIGRYDPDTDEVEKIAMPDDAARDPHTMVFDKGERHIWFTMQGSNLIGRLTVADGTVRLIPVQTPGARPYGIRMAPDGTPWIALVGTNKLASVNAETLTLAEHELPAKDARPRRLEITSDGRIWYADYSRGSLGLYDPRGDKYKELQMPSGKRSRPYGMALDSSDRVWLVETGVSPNLFIGFDAKTEQFFSITPIPSGGGSVRHMDYHAPTQSVWFGTDENTLGRARTGGL